MAEQLFFSRDAKLYVAFENSAGVTQHLWEIPILDGFSFSQATNSSEITLSEMESTAGVSRRGRRLFNDSLAPAEWSFSTYVRPYALATDGDKVHAVEEVLWALMMGADTFDGSKFTYAGGPGDVSTPAVVATGSKFTFDQSNRSTLGTATFYFVMETGISGAIDPLVYKLEKGVVNEASIDFDVDGIATVNWSGFAKQIIDVTPRVVFEADGAGTKSVTNSNATIAAGDLYIDGSADNAFSILATAGADIANSTLVAAIDEAISSTNTFIRNRLTQVEITSQLLATGALAGKGSGVYSINLTGGNITISNNITYLTPEELGTVNIPIEHVTGSRSVSGSMTCYITHDADTEQTANAGSSSDFFNDLTSAAALELVVNDFEMIFKIGGTNVALPRLNVKLPQAHVEIPTHSIEDVISLETTFHGLPSTISNTDEATLTYFGVAPD
jgi:hypothetical protein